MELHGIYAEPGTVVGVELRSLRFVVADVVDTNDFNSDRLPLRYADELEVQRSAFMHEPRSVAEHHAIPRLLTPFGMGRVFRPTPYPRTDGTDPFIGRYSGRPVGILNAQ